MSSPSYFRPNPCNFCKQILESSPSVPLSKPCDFCNQVIESERYIVRPHIICLKAKETAIAAGERAFKVKDKIVIHDVDTRTVLDSTWRAGDTCPRCGLKVTDEIRRSEDKTIECSDRFPVCLNVAPMVQKNGRCPWCGQSLFFPKNGLCPLCAEPDWFKIRFGVTKFHKWPAQEDWPFIKGSYPPPDKVIPGQRMETDKPGSDSSTDYSRFHHSTKCNGWSRRFTEPEWQELFKSIIRPLDARELEELVYGTAELDDRELKDPKPKKEDISIFDEPIKTYFRGLFLGISAPVKYKKMSLAEAKEWHNSRLEYSHECYKNSILHPLQPKPHEFIDPYYEEHGRTNPEYWRYNLAHRFGFRGKKKITLDYFKFPAQIGKLEQESEGHISGGRYERCQHESSCPLLLLPPKLVNGIPKHIDCQIYTTGSYVEGSPGGKKTSFHAGPLERDEFALELACDSFALVSNPLKAPNPHRISIMGSMISPHVNQIGQSLNTKKKQLGRIYPLQKCGYCDGILYYRNRGEIVCNECATVADKLIVTTEYMNRVWNDLDEVETPVTLGKSLARPLNALDIKFKQIGRVCGGIGCSIFELDNNTALQHQFTQRFEELYGIILIHQVVASKIEFFKKKLNGIRC